MSRHPMGTAVATGAGLAAARFRFRWSGLAVFLPLLAIALYPVWTSEVPGLVDYPNHLARAYILSEVDQNPVLAERYAVNWGVIPNLAMDVIVPALARHLSIFDAGRLFLTATMLLLVAGTVAIHRAIYGSVGFWPAASVLFLYNHVLAWGFLNYLFGAGLAMLAFAGWIATAQWPSSRRLTLFSLATAILFFAHIFAVAIYGILVMCYELWRGLGRRPASLAVIGKNVALAGPQFVTPMVLWLSAPVSLGESVTTQGTWTHKLVALMSPVLFAFKSADFMAFLFVAAACVAGLATGAIRFAPQLRYPLIGLCVAAAAMPHWLFSAVGAGFRLPPIIALLAIAGTRPVLRRELAIVLAGAALAVFVIKVASVSASWREFDRQAAEFRAASTVIERGARLLVVQEREPEIGEALPVIPAVYWNLPALAVIDRDVFFPILFTDPGKQPVISTHAFRSIDTPYGTPISLAQLREGADPDTSAGLAGKTDDKGRRIYWANWPENFDFVLSVHFRPQDNPLPEHLALVRSGSFFDIYRVVR